MKLNDSKMLPRFLLKMENMRDLLQAEESVMQELHDNVSSQEQQLVISNATWGLGRHEKILGLPTDSESAVADRRSRIIAKLAGQGTVTKKLIQHVASSFTNGEVEVIEHPERYSFDVKFISTLGTPPNMADLSAALEEIKPAHLTYGYIVLYRTWGELEEKTWGELESRTWDEILGGEL